MANIIKNIKVKPNRFAKKHSVEFIVFGKECLHLMHKKTMLWLFKNLLISIRGLKKTEIY